jgi:hypothetical protein
LARRPSELARLGSGPWRYLKLLPLLCHLRDPQIVMTRAITSSVCLLALLVAGVACGDASTPPVVAKSSAQASTSSRAQSLSSQMTKPSGVYGIMLPADCAPIASAAGLCLSQIATVKEFTAYYQTFMSKRGGWTFDTSYSVMDPTVGVSKKLGYTTSQVWCQPTSPITTTIILVGSGNDKDQGNRAEISVMDDAGESSCP